MREYLLNGHIRTSTAILALVFTATLVTYLLVRPEQVDVASGTPSAPTTTTSRPARTTAPTAQETSAPATTATPRRSATPSPSVTSTRPVPTPAPTLSTTP
jgi:hypothetical protein